LLERQLLSCMMHISRTLLRLALLLSKSPLRGNAWICRQCLNATGSGYHAHRATDLLRYAHGLAHALVKARKLL
jgi:hypothetical protein